MKSVKKPRKTNLGGVTFTAKEGMAGNILFDEINGITVVDDGEHTVTKPLMYNLFYEGETKTRYLVSIPYNSKDYMQDVTKAFRDFDVVCAVDTSKLEEKMIVTVGVISIIANMHITDNEVKVDVTQVCIIKHHSESPTHFEQMNWLTAIHWIRSDSISRSILMIVDCDKDFIPEYNAKLIPVYGSEFLPDNVTLVYSKDDHDDTWMNQILDITDKTSKKIKNQFKEKGLYDFSVSEISTCAFIPELIQRP